MNGRAGAGRQIAVQFHWGNNRQGTDSDTRRRASFEKRLEKMENSIEQKLTAINNRMEQKLDDYFKTFSQRIDRLDEHLDEHIQKKEG